MVPSPETQAVDHSPPCSACFSISRRLWVALLLGFGSGMMFSEFFRYLWRLPNVAGMEPMVAQERKRLECESLSANGTRRKTNPRLQVGSWLGDSWVPPVEWKLFGKEELQDIFKEYSVLWFGDSTARRTAMSLYAILNDTKTAHKSNTNTADALSVLKLDWPVIDVNRRQIDEPCRDERFRDPLSKPPGEPTDRAICRTMPNSQSKTFVWLDHGCYCEVEQFAQNEMAGITQSTANMDILIVSLGVWHNIRADDCLFNFDHPKQRPILNLLKDVLDSLYALLKAKPKLTIIWRTSGYSDRGEPEGVRAMNEFVLNYIDQRPQEKRMICVHWGGAMEPRSFKEDRLKGDMPHHYGLQPRLVMIQMIANVLYEKVKSPTGEGCHTVVD